MDSVFRKVDAHAKGFQKNFRVLGETYVWETWAMNWISILCGVPENFILSSDFSSALPWSSTMPLAYILVYFKFYYYYYY